MTADTYDAVVVGAGIVGAALGDHLTASGLGKVIIIEKESMAGTGSTGRSAGGIRQQFGDEAKIRAARFGFSRFESFQDGYGVDPCFRKHGYLILRTDGAGAEGLKGDVAVQRRLGLPTRYLEPAEIVGAFPLLNGEDLAGASFNATDGYLDFHAVMEGFLRAFRDRGGRTVFDLKAEGFLVERGQVLGVTHRRGTLLAGATFLAPGPQVPALLEPQGIRLPIRTCRRQIFSTGPTAAVPRDWPLVLDVDGPFYFRPEGDGVIMSLAEVEEMAPPEDGNEIPLSRRGLPELARRASHRCPVLGDAEIRSGWAGLRSITPDERPVLGPVPGLERLFVAAGFSGHGITLAPFAAEYLVRELQGDPFPDDLREPFLVSRFL